MFPFEFFSLNFEGDKLSPGRFFFKDNFNCSAGLAQWRGLAQTLIDNTLFELILSSGKNGSSFE